MKGLNVNYRMSKDLWNRQGLTTDRLLSFMKKAKKNRQQNITTNGWQAHIMTDDKTDRQENLCLSLLFLL